MNNEQCFYVLILKSSKKLVICRKEWLLPNYSIVICNEDNATEDAKINQPINEMWNVRYVEILASFNTFESAKLELNKLKKFESLLMESTGSQDQIQLRRNNIHTEVYTKKNNLHNNDLALDDLITNTNDMNDNNLSIMSRSISGNDSSSCFERCPYSRYSNQYGSFADRLSVKCFSDNHDSFTQFSTQMERNTELLQGIYDLIRDFYGYVKSTSTSFNSDIATSSTTTYISNSSNNNTISNSFIDDEFLHLPLRTIEQMYNLEQNLINNREIYDKTLNKLMLGVTEDLQITTRRLLSTILHPTLACQLTYTGNSKKFGIKDCQFFIMIKDILINKHINKGKTLDEINKTIIHSTQNWFHDRRLRKRSKPVTVIFESDTSNLSSSEKLSKLEPIEQQEQQLINEIHI
ncbi:hypothetical protein MN116_006474 [Schistosoma mekongi]|uniref:DUF4806 domain-containing protein n=1 Tax=Schistosoma mekongi TaxID=38744 RepID=A0AAE1ZCE6_SCHME|nr:hypothetical protein MN116_006474 [Schistosoma mekongi]